MSTDKYKRHSRAICKSILLLFLIPPDLQQRWIWDGCQQFLFWSSSWRIFVTCWSCCLFTGALATLMWSAIYLYWSVMTNVNGRWHFFTHFISQQRGMITSSSLQKGKLLAWVIHLSNLRHNAAHNSNSTRVIVPHNAAANVPALCAASHRSAMILQVWQYSWNDPWQWCGDSHKPTIAQR